MINKQLLAMLDVYTKNIEASNVISILSEPFESQDYEYRAFSDNYDFRLVQGIEYSVLLNAKAMYLTEPVDITETILSDCMKHPDPFKVLLSSLEKETIEPFGDGSYYPVELKLDVEKRSHGYQLEVGYNFGFENNDPKFYQRIFEAPISENMTVKDAYILYAEIINKLTP